MIVCSLAPCSAPALPLLPQGRYISISAQSRVSLCQVEVYPESGNAALGKPTTSSGADDDSTQAAQVVNGNMNNIMCAQVSTADPSAWITIDLGYEARVDTVVVQNGYSNFDEKSGMLFLRWACGRAGV